MNAGELINLLPWRGAAHHQPMDAHYWCPSYKWLCASLKTAWQQAHKMKFDKYLPSTFDCDNRGYYAMVACSVLRAREVEGKPDLAKMGQPAIGWLGYKIRNTKNSWHMINFAVLESKKVVTFDLFKIKRYLLGVRGREAIFKMTGGELQSVRSWGI